MRTRSAPSGAAGSAPITSAGRRATKRAPWARTVPWARTIRSFRGGPGREHRRDPSVAEQASQCALPCALSCALPCALCRALCAVRSVPRAGAAFGSHRSTGRRASAPPLPSPCAARRAAPLRVQAALARAAAARSASQSAGPAPSCCSRASRWPPRPAHRAIARARGPRRVLGAASEHWRRAASSISSGGGS